VDGLSTTGSAFASSVGTTYGYYWTPPVYLSSPRELPGLETTITLALIPSANVARLDYIQYLPLGTLLKVTQAGADGSTILFDALGVIRTLPGVKTLGQVPQLCPGCYNVLAHVHILEANGTGDFRVLALAPAWGLL